MLLRDLKPVLHENVGNEKLFLSFTPDVAHAGLAGSEIWPFQAADFPSKMAAGAIFNFFKFIPIYTRII